MNERILVPLSTWKLEDINEKDKFPNGCFKVTYNALPDTSEEEAGLFRELAKDINMFAQDLGTSADRSKLHWERTNQIRVQRLKDLRDLSEHLKNGRIDGHNAIKKYGIVWGTNLALSNTVHKAEAATLDSSDGENAEAVKTWRLTFKPLLDGATPEQVALSIEIQKAYDVVDLVMDRRQSKLDNVRAKLTNLTTPGSKQSLAVRKSYVRQLKEIADEGLLSQELTAYAARKLELFKQSFVQREADRVKNQHVRALGTWAALFALTFLVCGVLVYGIRTYLSSFKNTISVDQFKIIADFMFLSAGGCIGAWLSFTLRKVEMGFDDLILLEPDRLSPTARVVFVVLLTCVIGGILQLGWVTVSFSEKPLMPGTGPGTALLLGTFCGIAERSLSGVVAGRAHNMAVMIDQSTTPKGDQ